MDNIQIKSLQINTHIGAYAWEQRILQRLFLDITLERDLSVCEDQLANTLDYAAICNTVTEFLQKQSFQLIETVAEKTAALLHEQFHVSNVLITVSKPDAIKNASAVGVTIRREW